MFHHMSLFLFLTICKVQIFSNRAKPYTHVRIAFEHMNRFYCPINRFLCQFFCQLFISGKSSQETQHIFIVFFFACFLTSTSDVNTLLSSTSFGFPNLAAFTISTSPQIFDRAFSTSSSVI